jgi:hypothetical protein
MVTNQKVSLYDHALLCLEFKCHELTLFLQGLDDMQDRLGLGLRTNTKGMHKARELAAVCQTIIKDGYELAPNRYKN